MKSNAEFQQAHALDDSLNSDDQQFIDACLAGDTEAFGRLVERHQDRLCNTLFNVLGSTEDARDVAQESFVQAFNKLDTFQGRSAFYTWLYRIAMNTAVTYRRKHRRGTISIEASRERIGSEPVDARPDNQPDQQMEAAERQALVRTALSEISIEYRTVLVLKEMEGLKYEEIAEIVNCPIGTVRSRIHRARNDLRERLRILLKED